ncbi:MAG: N-acetylneuraminate synthase family protein [Bacteroidia bacterium]
MFTIAEIGQAHEGSLGIAHSYIDALAKTGVDAIKWQMHIANAESSLEEPFRINFSYEDYSRMEYWRRMEFTKDQWISLKNHSEQLGIEFICSPFSNTAVEILEDIGVNRYKIGSGEVSNFLMLERIAKTGKEVLLSSGMSSYSELDKAVEMIQSYGAPLSIFQCTTAYPTNPKNWGLNVINELKNRYKVPVGFSDHSGDIYACLAATTLGAELLEFHVVFDKRMFGPDSESSLTINETSKLIKGIKDIRKALEHHVDKSDNSEYDNLKAIFEKSLAVNKNVCKGQVLTFNDLEAKKPKGQGISAHLFKEVLGKKLTKDLAQWAFLTKDCLEDE